MPTPNSGVLAPMLNKLALRSPLGPAETNAILALPYRLIDAEPGTYLVREGSTADDCCLVLSGLAYRSKVTRSGSRQIVAIQMQGDLVDIQNSFLEKADYNVQALIPGKVAYIPSQAILNLIEAYPAIGRALWLDTMVDASISREWILNNGQRNARQRVAHLLCELALCQGSAGVPSATACDLPMTQDEIGEATGLTPVHVNRTLKALRADGFITTARRKITITNWSSMLVAGDFCDGYLHLPTLPITALPIVA